MRIVIGNKSSHYNGPWGFLAQVVVMTLAALLAQALLPSVTFDSIWAAIITSVVIALLNNFLRPILVVVTLPFMILSFGLFLLVINTLLILFADLLVSGFHSGGFGSALLFGILLTVINYLLELPNRILMRRSQQETYDDPSSNPTSHRALNNDSEDVEYTDFEEVDDDNDAYNQQQ